MVRPQPAKHADMLVLRELVVFGQPTHPLLCMSCAYLNRAAKSKGLEMKI